MKQPGLRGRRRDQDGQIGHKCRDNLGCTLRDKYGEDFAKGYRLNAQLGTVLDKEGKPSLRESSNSM